MRHYQYKHNIGLLILPQFRSSKIFTRKCKIYIFFIIYRVNVVEIHADFSYRVRVTTEVEMLL